MTYGELLKQLQCLSPEQLDCNLAVELALTGETLSCVGPANKPDVRFDIAGETHDTLDEHHPVFVVQY